MKFCGFEMSNGLWLVASPSSDHKYLRNWLPKELEKNAHPIGGGIALATGNTLYLYGSSERYGKFEDGLVQITEFLNTHGISVIDSWPANDVLNKLAWAPAGRIERNFHIREDNLRLLHGAIGFWRERISELPISNEEIGSLISMFGSGMDEWPWAVYPNCFMELAFPGIYMKVGETGDTYTQDVEAKSVNWCTMLATKLSSSGVSSDPSTLPERLLETFWKIFEKLAKDAEVDRTSLIILPNKTTVGDLVNAPSAEVDKVRLAKGLMKPAARQNAPANNRVLRRA